MSPTRAFAVVLALVSVGCAAFAFRSTEDPVQRVESGSIGTPLWSPRRVPQPIVDAVGGQRLQASLDAKVGNTQSCFVVDEGGAPLATRLSDVALVPASTEKLITAAMALSVLGPDTRLVTRVVAEKPTEGGVVQRLWMVGGGDFLLMTPEAEALRQEIPELRGMPVTSLAALADSIVAAGVKRVPGGIVGDDSRYETLRYLPTWKESYRTEGQVGPLGALTVNGGFSELRPEPVPVADPALFAAAELARLLEARGVTIGRGADRGNAPGGAVEIAKIESPPMTTVVGEVLSASDNLGAELLTREIGLQASQQGTTSAGTQAMVAQLAKLDLPTGTITLVDGSGLDRGNRVSCQLLDAVLDLGEETRFEGLWAGLAVAGQSGTLIDQLDGTPLEGKLRGKTGSLDGVTGLVGIIDVGRPLRFAFIANGAFTEADGIRLRGEIAAIIASFPDSPPADALVPAPAAGGDPEP
jgi:serine-type D-Ala-D-Ala carboxypeptidase/endopeptidase (penicillin-binding protein 4)